MIEEGTQAPLFELPAVVEGRPGRVSLESVLGTSVVVLVFYPSDFNPSCTDKSTDLDEFDVFRMQSDASVLAVSGDSLFSHQAFARKHDLQLPLLADTDGEVARAYGVESADERYANHRAVVVIDTDGEITHTWLAETVEQRPSIKDVQTAFAAIGDADLAEAQYKHGRESYGDGRESFVAGTRAYEHREWMLARGEFETALTELGAATEAFRRASRFSETCAMTTSYEQAEQVTQTLCQAVCLLSDAASAHASGDSVRGRSLREEAQTVLTEVRELGAPPSPEELPVADDTDESPGKRSPGPDVTTGEDLSDAVGESPLAEGAPDADAPAGSRSGAADPDDTTPEAGGETAAGHRTDTGAEPDDIDEAELEAITAEIETQEASTEDDENGASE